MVPDTEAEALRLFLKHNSNEVTDAAFDIVVKAFKAGWRAHEAHGLANVEAFAHGFMQAGKAKDQ